VVMFLFVFLLFIFCGRCNAMLWYNNMYWTKLDNSDLFACRVSYKSVPLTALPLRAQICAQLFNELRACLITFPIFVRCQRLIARNDRELFSSNRGVSHLNEACRIDALSRGSILGYEILTFN
jgi:hypothetical protein